MDLFDLGEGFSSLSEGVARIQCPTLVGTRQRAMEAFSFFFFFFELTGKDPEKVLFKKVDVMSPFGAEGCRPSVVVFSH